MQVLLRFFLMAIAFLLSTATQTFAMPEIIPLDKIQSGMSGVAYTIVDNTGVIKPFNVDIIGLMDNGKGSTKMIMAKASGSVIEETGGILQGMSGSPVYVDGKLIGAVSAGLKEMSPYTFFITPIESMLELWNLPDNKAVNKYIKPAENEDVAEIPDKLENIQPQPENSEQKSVFFFSGFDSSGLNFLKNELQPLGFKNFYAASSSASKNDIKFDASLEPGSAIGVAVVCGDFLVGATGTVTAVDDKRIIGFGHPFTHAGNVNFFMTDSYVVGSVSGADGNGVKIAGVGNIIGRINQDRESGVAGLIGKFPSVVPISVTIKNPALNKSETYNATIAYNENLIPKLGASIAYTALSKTADSLSESTVTVDFEIKTNVVEGGVLSRRNMFYSQADVGQLAISELLQSLTLICSNTTEESNIFGIDVNMTMNPERKTASLISAIPDKKKVKPGDTVNLTVTLQPYRKPEERIIIPYTVPISMKEGPMVLDLHGGSLVPVAKATTASAAVITPSTSTPKEIYAEKIKKLVSTGKSNQLVVELNSASISKTPKEIKKDLARAKKVKARLAKSGQKITPASVSKIDTGYIIDNVIQITLNVDKI